MVKTSELDERSLDLYVWRIECADYKKFKQSRPDDYSPSTNWQQGGPLIEKYHITIGWNRKEDYWVADRHPPPGITYRKIIYIGKTPLIAAMRCIVASEYGDKVEEEN